MADKAWKAYERRVARFFGSERTPLSGINSRHDTSSDSLHSTLYVETKSAAGPSGSNGWLWRWLRRMDWPRGMMGMYRKVGSYIYVVHSGAFLADPKVEWWSKGVPRPAMKLYRDVQSKAKDEKKAPLIALCGKGKRGFWLVGEAGAILAAQDVRRKVAEG